MDAIEISDVSEIEAMGILIVYFYAHLKGCDVFGYKRKLNNGMSE